MNLLFIINGFDILVQYFMWNLQMQLFKIYFDRIIWYNKIYFDTIIFCNIVCYYQT